MLAEGVACPRRVNPRNFAHANGDPAQGCRNGLLSPAFDRPNAMGVERQRTIQVIGSAYTSQKIGSDPHHLCAEAAWVHACSGSNRRGVGDMRLSRLKAVPLPLSSRAAEGSTSCIGSQSTTSRIPCGRQRNPCLRRFERDTGILDGAITLEPCFDWCFLHLILDFERDKNDGTKCASQRLNPESREDSICFAIAHIRAGHDLLPCLPSRTKCDEHSLLRVRCRASS